MRRWQRAGWTIRRVAAGAALLALGAVAAARVPAVAATPPVAGAHGERAWMAWSHRHGSADPHLAALAARLDATRCLSVVVEAGEDPAWWRSKALYHLRRHRVVEVRRVGEPGAAGAECLVVKRTPTGGFRIAKRSRG